MNISKMVFQEHLSIKTASKYAILLAEGKTRKEIKKELDLSDVQAFRAYEKCLSDGIIKGKVYPALDEDLSEEIRTKYSLKEAKVYHIGAGDKYIDYLGQVAAQYLDDLLTEESSNIKTVAIGPGRTMSATVDSLVEEERPDITVWSTSEASHIEFYLASNMNVVVAMKKWQCRLNRFDKKGSLDKKENNPSDVIVIGAGNLVENRDIATYTLILNMVTNDARDIKREMGYLSGEGGIGIINYQIVNEDGEQIKWRKKKYDRYNKALEGTSMYLDTIKTIAKQQDKYVVCVAGDLEKTDAIKAALKGEYFNVLITDSEVGEELLKEDE